MIDDRRVISGPSRERSLSALTTQKDAPVATLAVDPTFQPAGPRNWRVSALPARACERCQQPRLPMTLRATTDRTSSGLPNRAWPQRYSAPLKP